MRFCVHCGKELVEGANFCAFCGKEIGVLKIQSIDKRKIVYDGVIHKCPNCGNVINQIDLVCSGCGFYLTGEKTVCSAKDFSEQLLKIEMTRQDKKIGFWNQRERDDLDVTDNQILALIKTYAIPNTIEDLVEFFYLKLLK